jgi:hypothetical protein
VAEGGGSVGVVMTVHKLTAGDGYTYLTRQVAALDATDRGYGGLGAYYAERGESPGVWVGSGVDRLPHFLPGPVTEAQMRALFGEGRHPDAERIERDLTAAGWGAPAVLAATRLGRPLAVSDRVNPFRARLAVEYAAQNESLGFPTDWPLPANERAEIRTRVAREMFAAEYGRGPVDARELSGFVARASRQATTAVAGYDLTNQYRTSWAPGYLTDRLGTDLTDHPIYQPGYAPPGWTHTIDHLRRLGATDTELLDTGLATTTRTGRLIDRYRDRLILPIHNNDGELVGFITRRNPARDNDDHAGPKYLNTPDTELFSKGAGSAARIGDI